MMAFSAGFVYMCGPADLGGRNGKPVDHRGHDCKDRIFIPGMPPMACRDLNPQDVGDKAVSIQSAEAAMTRYASHALDYVLIS
jgi:hypothetical protein